MFRAGSSLTSHIRPAAEQQHSCSLAPSSPSSLQEAEINTHLLLHNKIMTVGYLVNELSSQQKKILQYVLEPSTKKELLPFVR